MECMRVASGCGEQEAGVASGSGWNLWVWLVGGGCGCNLWLCLVGVVVCFCCCCFYNNFA